MEIKELLEKVRQVAYELHVYLGTGLLEKVYENGLKHRLERAGLKVEAQKPLKVFDVDGFCLGDYFADLYVDDKLVVELKAVKAIANEHYAQILNYLKITGAPAGLLVNFGSSKFEVRTVIPRNPSPFGASEPCRRVGDVGEGGISAAGISTSSPLLHGQPDSHPGPASSTSSTLLHG